MKHLVLLTSLLLSTCAVAPAMAEEPATVEVCKTSQPDYFKMLTENGFAIQEFRTTALKAMLDGFEAAGISIPEEMKAVDVMTVAVAVNDPRAVVGLLKDGCFVAHAVMPRDLVEALVRAVLRDVEGNDGSKKL